MNDRKINWLIYTIIVGLLPAITRAIVYLLYKKAYIDFLINEGDLIFFSLVLNITNINQIQQITHNNKPITIQTGFSLVFIIILCMLLTLSYLATFDNTAIDSKSLKIVSAIICLPSILISYHVFCETKAQET